MNKIYRIVWNAITSTWVAVAETAKGHGKASGSVGTVAAALALAGLALAAPAFAQTVAGSQLPSGGNVVAGSANISQSAAVMSINQSTNRAAIDWATFNVGSAAQVNFNQPSASSVTLNRVLDSNPSQIFGRISAPGQVFLTNPSGVYFAPGSSVNVGGLVATTHRISSADFMAGKTTFERSDSTGRVINAGELKAALGGYIALLAPEVRNQGVIVAQAGTVVLASGEAITLNFGENNTLAGITATKSQIAALVENKNAVLAPGGLIILSAQAMSQLQGSVVNNSGSLSATGLIEKGGRIFLDSGEGGQTLVSGSIDASSASGKGGSIQVLGDKVGLFDGTRIDASGATGGGTVLVGGDWQGSGTLRQATTVTMEAGATIYASATQSGDGGTVVLWSDIHNAASQTRAYGTIMAKGGAEGGKGGQVETSGYELNVDGIQVSTLAADGSAGDWLLDPFTIRINSNGSNYTNTSGTFISNETTTSVSGDPTSYIAGSAIATQLNSTNVTVQTTVGSSGIGDIILQDDGGINYTGSAARTLTFKAHRDVIFYGHVDAKITSTNAALAVTIQTSATNGHSGGSFDMGASSSIVTNGGAFTHYGTSSVGGQAYRTQINGTINTGSGSFSANAQYFLGSGSLNSASSFNRDCPLEDFKLY